METKRICTSKVFCKSWTPAYKKFVPKHSGLSNSDLEQIGEKTYVGTKPPKNLINYLTKFVILKKNPLKTKKWSSKMG
jgi:hypothetical protein